MGNLATLLDNAFVWQDLSFPKKIEVKHIRRDIGGFVAKGDLSNTLTAAARRQHYGEECIIDFHEVIQTPCSSSHAESA